jgi:hypothetical protein
MITSRISKIMNTHAKHYEPKHAQPTHLQVKELPYLLECTLHELVNEIDDISDYDNRTKSDMDWFIVMTKYYTFLQEIQVWDYAIPSYSGTSFTCDTILHDISHYKTDYESIDGQPVTRWWFGKFSQYRHISDDFWNAMTTLEQSIQSHKQNALHHIVVPHTHRTRYQQLLEYKLNMLEDTINMAIYNKYQYDEFVATIDYYQYLTWYQPWRSDMNCRHHLLKQLKGDEASFTSHRDSVGDLYYETTEQSRFDRIHTWSPYNKMSIRRFLRAVRDLRMLME